MIAAGTQVGSYKLIRLLGQPGQDGQVWEGIKYLTPSGAALTHAIKLLHNLTPEAHARFDEEIKHLAKAHAEIKSPHLIEIYDGGLHPDDGKQIPFYAMKLLTKPMRLDDFLSSRGMEPNLTVSMFQEAVEGLRDLHDRLERNHTDIKGSNLLVSMDSPAKLYITDFGFIRKRGEPIDASRTWKDTSKPPPDWVLPNDTDIWQLGKTLRPLLKGVTSSDTSLIRWLRHLMDEMAPAKATASIPTAQDLWERLECRKNLRRSGVWCWPSLPVGAVASLVATAYEYSESPLTNALLIDILLRERRPTLPQANQEILQVIHCDLPEPRSPIGAKGSALSPKLTEEVAKRILFGLPYKESQLGKAAEEWKYLKALIGEIPPGSPDDADESVYRKYAGAVIRQGHVQLSLWDAGVRFLTSGQGTRVVFCSGYDEFAVSKGPLGETDLRTTAIESLRRGARFLFVVPTANTEAASTAQDFKKYVKVVASDLNAQIEIKRIGGRRGTAGGGGGKKQLPEWIEMGRYFTPGFRYVLFKEEDATKAVHDEGAFLVGLPHRTRDLFALQYSLDHWMTKDFLEWLRFVGALKSA